MALQGTTLGLLIVFIANAGQLTAKLFQTKHLIAWMFLALPDAATEIFNGLLIAIHPVKALVESDESRQVPHPLLNDAKASFQLGLAACVVGQRATDAEAEVRTIQSDRGA